MARTAIPAALLLALGLSSPALADPCEWRMGNYGPPPRPDASITCTCGPPRGLTLDLGALTAALDPEAPVPFEGTLLQQVGGVFGTWTYSNGSTICLAAQNAGLIADPDFGAEITVQVAPGCERYAGGTRNGVTTLDRGSDTQSFFFPAVSKGACPGEPGYLPARLQLATFQGWAAYAFGRDDGTWSCTAVSSAAGSGLFLHLNEDALQFRPSRGVPEGARLRLAFDGKPFLLPMAVRNGRGTMPVGVAAGMLKTAGMIAITVSGTDAPDITHVWPLAGIADAYGRAAEECGWEQGKL